MRREIWSLPCWPTWRITATLRSGYWQELFNKIADLQDAPIRPHIAKPVYGKTIRAQEYCRQTLPEL